MPELVRLSVDGKALEIPAGASAAAAVFAAGSVRFRRSVSGEPRAPLCGMGICLECRLTIDGIAHRLSCLVPARDGMEIETTR